MKPKLLVKLQHYSIQLVQTAMQDVLPPPS